MQACHRDIFSSKQIMQISYLPHINCERCNINTYFSILIKILFLLKLFVIKLLNINFLSSVYTGDLCGKAAV